MTQYSFAWSCVETGDGGATSYSVEVVEAMNRLMGNLHPSDEGVVYWTDPTVFPNFTNPIGGTPSEDFFLNLVLDINGQVIVQPGAGMVQGWGFINDEPVFFTVGGGNPGATDIIGLRRSLVGQTVRLFHGAGAAGVPYVPIQSAVTHEIPLWEIPLDGSGDIIELVDVRNFVRTPLYPVQSYSTFYPVTRGWEGAELSPGDPLLQVGENPARLGEAPQSSVIGGMATGVLFPTSPGNEYNAWTQQFVQIPEDLIGGQINFEFVMYCFGGPETTGELYLRLGYIRESDPTTVVLGAFVAVPWTSITEIQNFNWFDMYGTTVPCDPGELMFFLVHQNGTNVNNTFDGVYPVMTGVRVYRNKAQADQWHSELPMQ